LVLIGKAAEIRPAVKKYAETMDERKISEPGFGHLQDNGSLFFSEVRLNGGIMRARLLVILSLLLLVTAGISAAEQTPLLATWPTVNQTSITFSYGGYLWTVPRTGGEARQLTTGGHETTPLYSPDGKWLAFTGQYDGNADVYVMPAKVASRNA